MAVWITLVEDESFKFLFASPTMISNVITLKKYYKRVYSRLPVGYQMIYERFKICITKFFIYSSRYLEKDIAAKIDMLIL